MLQLETALIPTFLARDLTNLSPLSYNNFDMSRILKDIETLRNESNLVKSRSESYSNVVQGEVCILVTTVRNNQKIVNIR